MAKKDKKKREKRARLVRAACSWRWAIDVEHGMATSYPVEKMPLSRAKVLNADGKNEVLNPKGEVGEQRHTPQIAVDLEDTLDLLTPDEAERYSGPSSAGCVVSMRDLMKKI